MKSRGNPFPVLLQFRNLSSRSHGKAITRNPPQLLLPESLPSIGLSGTQPSFFEKNFSTLLTTSDDFSIIIEDIRFTCKLNQQL